jgi:membrane protein
MTKPSDRPETPPLDPDLDKERAEVSVSPATAMGEAGRGRDANGPGEIPAAGWRDILLRLWRQTEEENVMLIAAAVAFYMMLAVFPAIGAFIAFFGVFADPQVVESQFSLLRGIITSQAWTLLDDQLVAIIGAGQARLKLATVIGLAFALWTGGAGIRAMMTSLNIVYFERETRGYLAFYGTAFVLTIGSLVLGMISLAIIIAVPLFLEIVGLARFTEDLVAILRWPLIGLIMIFCLGVLYRYGPSRRGAKTRWLSVGAIVATVLWLAGSVLFSTYVSNFGSYNETYGAIGAVIVMLMWFWVTAYVVLLGAQINAEIELQTLKDSTIGDPKPLGRRGAFVADHVGKRP